MECRSIKAVTIGRSIFACCLGMISKVSLIWPSRFRAQEQAWVDVSMARMQGMNLYQKKSSAAFCGGFIISELGKPLSEFH
jgi:hypothetical protein